MMINFNRSSILDFVNSESDEDEKDILEYPEAECLLRHISRQIKKKKNFNAIFSGMFGNGKSYAGCRLLELWYLKRFKEKFPIKHIVSNLSEALLLVKNFKRKGEGILIEEISSSAGSRDSQTTQNKLFNKFLDVCRIRQAVIIMNCPHISFADKHIRMAVHSWVYCTSVDFEREIVVAHPLWLQTSPHKSEPYKHHYLTPSGEEIGICYFRKPSDYIKIPYDKSKDKFTDDFIDELHFKMVIDRKNKLKQLGAKFLSPRESEAYTLWLSGYKTSEATEKMGLKNAQTFRKYLKNAKEKLLLPEYAKELAILNKNTPKKNQNPATPLI